MVFSSKNINILVMFIFLFVNIINDILILSVVLLYEIIFIIVIEFSCIDNKFIVVLWKCFVLEIIFFCLYLFCL